MDIITLLSHLSGIDVALTINRLAVGLFFTLSATISLGSTSGHAEFLATMRSLGVPFPEFNAWFVPGTKAIAGPALMLGLFPMVAAMLLAAICLVATIKAGPGMVAGYEPKNLRDKVADYLYLPEVALGLALLPIILSGPDALCLTFIC